MCKTFNLDLKGVLRDDKTALTQLIIANMFREYKEHIVKNGQERTNNFGDQKEIIQCFSKVVDSIKYIENSVDKNLNSSEDNIDLLLGLSNSIDIVENITELVEKFVKIIKKDTMNINYKCELTDNAIFEKDNYWEINIVTFE